MIRYIILVLMMFASQAFAGMPDVFTPTSDDWVIKILGKIFGDLFPGGGVSPLGSAMEMFNSGILIIGGIYGVYTLKVGIMGTATDGKIMGKLSSVWIVIRYCLATPLLIPLSTGFCTAQYLIAWVAIQGNGLADQMWDKYTSNQNAAIIAVAGEEFTGAKDLVYNIYQSYGCLYALKHELSGSGNIDPILLGDADKNTVLSIWSEENSDSYKYYFGDKNESKYSKDICGTITVPKINVPTITTSSSSEQALIIDFDAAPELSKKVQQVEKTAFDTLIASIDPLAQTTISSGKAIDYKQLDAITTNYQKTLAEISSSVVQSIDGLNTLSKNAKKGGWITSYTYFMQYAYLHDQISTALHNVPTADGPKNAGHESLSGNFSTTIVPVLKTVTDGGQFVAFGGYNQDGSDKSSSNDSGSFIDSIKGFMNKFKPTEILKKVFLDTHTAFTAKKGEFPIYTMTRMGNTMFVSATAGITASGVALATVGAHPGIAALLQVLISIIFVPMLAIGFMLKWYLPFLPFIIGIGVLGGIILGTAVSIIVAPAWILGHLNPHADDLVGSSGNGYRIMLAMGLRPALTTLGVATSFFIILAVGDYINEMIAPALLLSQSGSGFFTVVIDFIALPVLYGILIYKLIMNTLPMSHKIADEALQVLGGGGFSPGSYADAIAHQDNHGAAANAMGAAAGGAAGAMGANAAAKRLQAGNGGNGEKPQGIDPREKKSGFLNKMFGKEKEGPAPSRSQKEVSELLDGSLKGGSLKNEQLKSTYAKMNEGLGGENSPLGRKFNENLDAVAKDPENSILSSDNMLYAAMDKTLKKSFGGTATKAIQAYAGSYSGEKFAAAVNQFSQAKSNVFNNADYSPKEASSAIRTAASGIINDFKNNAEGLKAGTITPEQIFDNNLGQFTDRKMSPSVEAPISEVKTEPVEPAPVQESPVIETKTETPTVEVPKEPINNEKPNE